MFLVPNTRRRPTGLFRDLLTVELRHAEPPTTDLRVRAFPLQFGPTVRWCRMRSAAFSLALRRYSLDDQDDVTWI